MTLKSCFLVLVLLKGVFCLNFSFFEYSLPVSDFIVSKKCKDHIKHYLYELDNGATWAAKSELL